MGGSEGESQESHPPFFSRSFLFLFLVPSGGNRRKKHRLVRGFPLFSLSQVPLFFLTVAQGPEKMKNGREEAALFFSSGGLSPPLFFFDVAFKQSGVCGTGFSPFRGADLTPFSFGCTSPEG